MGPLTITRRLIALVTVPLLFTGGFAAWAVTTTSREAVSADTLLTLIATADEGAVLADRLQQERAAAAAVLSAGSTFEQLESYVRLAAQSDAAIATYRRQREQVSSAPPTTEELLARIDDQVARLPALRDDVREAPTAALSAVAFAYRITIADLVALREAVAQAEGGSAELVGQIRASAALSHATEFIARLQVEVMSTTAIGSPTTPADQQAVLAIQAGYSEAMAAFSDMAPAQWRDWLDHALTGDEILLAQRMQDQLARAPVGEPLVLDRPQWMKASDVQISALHGVERRVDQAVRIEIEALRASKVRWLAAQATVVLLALFAAVAMAVRQSRSMIRRLRGLAAAARSTAFVSLPETVATLRAIGTRMVDPDEFADQAEAPTPDRGGDEIADVSHAFLSVHRQAILTAADLANMRVGMSQIFLHLARRNQRLVGALMRELDGAERGEADPDRLATLFRLDQLATRMGRYTDNLLVVGGQTATRAGGGDVPLEEVLRGAQSKIERFQQIRFSSIDERLLVRGDGVHDLVNLLAELLDNATQFAPPQAFVTVECGPIGGRTVVRVTDQGVGIPPARLDQLNQTLAEPPSIDVSAIRSMGLTVVAHIATRHDVGVRLYPGPLQGTIADVTLPSSLCWLRPHSRIASRPSPPIPRPARPAPPAPASVPIRGAAERIAIEPPIYRDVEREFAGFFAASPGSARRPADAWQGRADVGWATAAAVAEPAVPGQTMRGLPRRDPMANLVPGAVPGDGSGPAAVDHRDPALVAQSVAAFAQGNAHSRALHANQ